MIENREVVAVAYDGLCQFEYGIACELFGLSRPELHVPWYNYRTVSAASSTIRSAGGLRITVSTNLRHIRNAGTIVLPGWAGPNVAPPRELVRAIRFAHDRGARVISICSGAFVLAETGLLDGQQATTHWRYVDQLRTMYPKIEVLPNVLFVDNGQTLTSAGSAAGIDLGLHLIRRDYGAAIAADVARRLVVAPQREGGQAQFIMRNNVRVSGDSSVAASMAWAERHLDEPISVADLAQRAHMSVRTYARRFSEETASTPLAWLTTQRLRLARELLESTNRPIADIAYRSGFGSIETMRHHFRNELGTSPARYRASFNQN